MPKRLVLPLDRDLERVVVSAASALDVTMVEFARQAVRQHAVSVLRTATIDGVATVSAGTNDDAVPNNEARSREETGIAVRPRPGRVIRVVSRALHVAPTEVLGSTRSRELGPPRTIAMYMLHEDAGLTFQDIAALTGRAPATVREIVHGVRRELQNDGPMIGALERCRKALHNGITDGRCYPPPSWTQEANMFLPALADHRRAAELTQPELASRAGLPRETVGRLEVMRRKARPETAHALAEALGVSVRALAGAE